MFRTFRYGMLLLAMVVVAGCGEESGSSGSAGGADLTAEQKSFIEQTVEKFDKLKTDSTQLIEQVKDKAESPEAEKAVAALEKALADAQEVVAALRSADGKTFADKRAAVEPVLKELASKYAAAAAKAKLGDVKIPGL